MLAVVSLSLVLAAVRQQLTLAYFSLPQKVMCIDNWELIHGLSIISCNTIKRYLTLASVSCWVTVRGYVPPPWNLTRCLFSCWSIVRLFFSDSPNFQDLQYDILAFHPECDFCWKLPRCEYSSTKKQRPWNEMPRCVSQRWFSLCCVFHHEAIPTLAD